MVVSRLAHSQRANGVYTMRLSKATIIMLRKLELAAYRKGGK